MTKGAPPRGFDAPEYDGRLACAQALMLRDGIDLMLLTTEPEIRYFTGFLTQFWQSPTRPWFLLVPASGRTVAVIPAIGRECMARGHVGDIRTWPAPTPADEGVSLLADTIRELAGKAPALGLPMGPETHLRMPLADFERLRAALPGLRLMDAGGIIRQLRMVKSPAEIEKIAHVCSLVSGVFEALPDFVTGGMTEAAVFRAFKTECLKAGVDDVSYLVGGAGPGGYGDIISPPGDRRLLPGDVLILDTGCVFDGYFCDFDRNYQVGAADGAARRAHSVVFEATEAGFAAARPGNTTSDVFHAMQRVMSAGGALGNDVGRLGHGLGMQLTEWPSNTADDGTELVSGMVLTLEPGMEFAPGKMMVHEENIVITETGAHWLTRRAPRDMPVIQA